MIQYLLNIVISPRKGWESLRGIEVPTRRILFQIVVPVLFVSGLMFLFSTLATHKVEWQQAILQFFVIVLSGVVTVFATAYLLNKLSKPFKGVTVFSKTFLVTSLAFSVFFFIWSIPALAPTLALPFRILSIYSLILFYRGAEVILSIRFEKLTGFTMLAALLFALTISVTGIFLSAIFQQPISF